METNKKVIWIYMIILMAFGITLVIQGVIYNFYYFIADFDDPNVDTIAFILEMAIGLCEIAIGAGSIVAGNNLLKMALINTEKTKSSSAEPETNTVTEEVKPVKKQKINFFTLHIISLCTLIIFLIAALYKALVGNNIETFIMVIPYFAVFCLLIFPSAIISKKRKQKKISEAKANALNELFFNFLGIYCLTIYFIYWLDIPTLVAFAVFLGAELARFIYLIVIIVKMKNHNDGVSQIEEVTSLIDNNANTGVDLESKESTISNDKEDGDYSI